MLITPLYSADCHCVLSSHLTLCLSALKLLKLCVTLPRFLTVSFLLNVHSTQGSRKRDYYSCMLCIKAWLPAHELRMDSNENPGFRIPALSYLAMPSKNCHPTFLCSGKEFSIFSLGTKNHILKFRGQIHTSLLSAASSWCHAEGQALISSLWWPVRGPTWMS